VDFIHKSKLHNVNSFLNVKVGKAVKDNEFNNMLNELTNVKKIANDQSKGLSIKLDPMNHRNSFNKADLNESTNDYKMQNVFLGNRRKKGKVVENREDDGLTYEEFKDFLRKMQIEMYSMDFDSLIGFMDPDRNKTISVDEFNDFLAQIVMPNYMQVN